MRTLFTLTFIFLLLTGCENHNESQAQRDARIAKEAKAELLAELKAQQEAEKKAREENSTLFKIGISQEGDRITIDTNKTRNFLEHFSKKFAQQMDQFSEELEENIDVNESYIKIDVKKTDHFLDKWHQKMQNFANEINALLKSFEHNTTQE